MDFLSLDASSKEAVSSALTELNQHTYRHYRHLQDVAQDPQAIRLALKLIRVYESSSLGLSGNSLWLLDYLTRLAEGPSLNGLFEHEALALLVKLLIESKEYEHITAVLDRLVRAKPEFFSNIVEIGFPPFFPFFSPCHHIHLFFSARSSFSAPSIRLL